MNYRHAYHAGNFADVMKHAALALAVEYLKQKEKPFFILDTHAGTGATDLSGEEAQKTGEYRDGIARVLAQETPHPALAPYLAALKTLGFDGAAAMRYPGSPLIARTLARPGDRLAFCELHPEDAAALSAICPVAMLFVRCKAGLSHHPDESIKPADAQRAIAVLVDFIHLLATNHNP